MREVKGWISDDGKFTSVVIREVEDYEYNLIGDNLSEAWNTSYGESGSYLLAFLDKHPNKIIKYIERNDPF